MANLHCRAVELILKEMLNELRSENIAPAKRQRLEKAIGDLRELHLYFAVEARVDLKDIALAHGISTHRAASTHNSVKRKFP